jgi:ABC-type transporter Mla maintaining outer membrane lipid asymmetry ATPase subunit MlaF
MVDTAAKNEKSDNVAIELAGVQVTHYEGPSEAVVVRDVDWRIGAGDFWVVGGRTSSGKSSLLMTAAGLSRPAGGALRIFGQDFSSAREKDRVAWRRRIGFVFEQSGRLFSLLTVARNIALPLQYRHAIKDDEIVTRVDELLTQTDLQDYASDMPSRLGLGVQQRVALARALASPIEVLFLDNPLSTLSLRESRWWLDFLQKLRESRRVDGKPLAIVASADDFRGWIGVASQFAVVEDAQFKVIGDREQVEAATEPAVRELLMEEI